MQRMQSVLTPHGILAEPAPSAHLDDPITPEPLHLISETMTATATGNPPANVDYDAVIDSLERIRPYIQGDGGDIELVQIEGHTVYIRVFGACVSCGALDMTMTHGIQSLLREEVDPEIVVEQML